MGYIFHGPDHDVEEMELWITNDYPLYKRMQAFWENYWKKKQKGKYNEKLAIKGLVNNLIPAAITDYRRQTRTRTFTLNKAQKTAVAKSLLKSEFAEFVRERRADERDKKKAVTRAKNNKKKK